MGIATNLVPILMNSARHHGWKGAVLTLGRQDMEATPHRCAEIARNINFQMARPVDTSAQTAAATPEMFFLLLGFDTTDSLDVSPHEGCTYCFDLNSTETPACLAGRYEVVLDGGTLEHVFHMPNALARVADFLVEGGFFVHIGPVNNYADHGFYQFSPTFFFDFFSANGWELLESAHVALLKNSADGAKAKWRVSPLTSGSIRDGGLSNPGPVMHYLVARKRSRATALSIPMQGVYQEKYGKATLRDAGARIDPFDPYELVDGIALADDYLPEEILSGPFRHDSGYCWIAELPVPAGQSDSAENPCHSTLRLYEDGRPLGVAHASHDEIRRKGNGRYSHWQGVVYFSASDSTDPTSNGRKYHFRRKAVTNEKSA